MEYPTRLRHGLRVRVPSQQRTNVRLEPQGYVEDNGKRGKWLDDRVVGIAPQELLRWFESISNLNKAPWCSGNIVVSKTISRGFDPLRRHQKK